MLPLHGRSELRYGWRDEGEDHHLLLLPAPIICTGCDQNERWPGVVVSGGGRAHWMRRRCRRRELIILSDGGLTEEGSRDNKM